MPTVERNRTIRPSSRQSTSKYRVNLEKIQNNDVIHIHIDHESKTFKESYTTKAKDLLGKKSLYFNVEENGNNIRIRWAGKAVPTKLSP